MISILVVGPDAVGPEATIDPGVEILQAQGAEEAIEKLARNRRIDAVLLLCGGDNSGILAAIGQEEPAPPPLYAPAEPPPPPGVLPLPIGPLEQLLDAIAADLGH